MDRHKHLRASPLYYILPFSMLVLGMTRQGVTALVAYNELIKLVTTVPSFSTMCNTLHLLHKKGLVEVTRLPPQKRRGGRSINQFKMTKLGKETLSTAVSIISKV